jgi:hypothetical protein
MNCRLFTIFAVLLISTYCSADGAYSMQFSKLEYFNSVMEQKPDILTIDNSGLARYESHSNVETPHHPEIGIYEKNLTHDEIELVRRMLDDPPLKSIPDHWGSVLPSDRYKRIRVTFGTETLEKLIGTKEPVEPSLRALFAQLDRVVAQVHAQPQQTLHSTLTEIRASPDGVVMAELLFYNSGIHPVLCRNPVNLLAAPNGKLTIELWPDNPPGVLRAEDSVSADVKQVVTVRLPSSVQAGHEIIEIPPKESASFRVRANVRVKYAGVYVARIKYMTTAEEISGDKPIVGELFSNTVKVNFSNN